MWGWGAAATPAPDPNVYGTVAKKFEDADFDLFVKNAEDQGPEWVVAHQDDRVIVHRKVRPITM